MLCVVYDKNIRDTLKKKKKSQRVADQQLVSIFKCLSYSSILRDTFCPLANIFEHLPCAGNVLGIGDIETGKAQSSEMQTRKQSMTIPCGQDDPEKSKHLIQTMW